ncbi:class I SAM-dependent methyltransferase [Streptomyces sp. NPDC005808]|uniref:class I SAM-dependent methyltransferase n=1 Tax=Streptomyces sp. NPDC005808 TaxID=3364734 RepID=UPI0036AA996E
MSDLDSQTDYWDAAAGTKRFTHPLHMPWLDDVSRSAEILDYGCGYGRTMNVLEQQGFGNLCGVDASPGMIAEARRVHPGMRFAVLDTPPTLALPDESVDAVLLFAVLTCIPGDDAQRRLIGELSRVLKPGGLLYLSDLLLQDDQRNRDRYASFAEQYGTYGVFRTDDGAVCRHHAHDWFSSLLAGFDSLNTRHITVSTMNGHESAGIQILARKPTPHHHAPTH